MSDNNLKVPSQVFLWFEKMKNNYENSVQVVLRQFESFTATQQARVDNANNENINNLKLMHSEQNQQNKDTISHLKNDIEYYKKQLTKQQETIEKLNARYDATMGYLLTDTRKNIKIKDIFNKDDLAISKQDFIDNPSSDENSFAKKIAKDITEIGFDNYGKNDDIFEQAMLYRHKNQLELAFSLFQQAAQNGHVKSMGAMGRAYFLNEGVDEDEILGLAWLINAAEQKLPQAISRVEQLKEQKPEIYFQAIKIANDLIKLTV